MSTLSIVVVNYNSKHFLDLCLHSVERALNGIESEVFVVDNASSDGSQEYIMPKYPWVTWIQNQENMGFAKANNKAIPLCTKRYVLLLNPDTIVPEDCFSKCIAFMEEHDECGALGAKMVDGGGTYLPESKRGLPTPMVSFFKLSGLYAFCPKSRSCSKYYMGHLPNNKIGKVEVLTGAFMFMRRLTIMRIGLLDEGYFMYGEDIDYSYRVLLGGYLNYYFPEVTIIHFKGEATNKNAFYIKVFYGAMQRFANQYFAHNKVFFFGFRPALYLVSRLALLKSFLSLPFKRFYFKKDVLPNRSRINIEGGDAAVDAQLKTLFPNATFISEITSRKRCASSIINLSNVNIKEFIDQLHKRKEAVYFLSPAKDFLLKSSQAKSLGKVFEIK